MPTYLTPGVYYERSDADYATISPLRTDVAAFVGIARRGPLAEKGDCKNGHEDDAEFIDRCHSDGVAYFQRAVIANPRGTGRQGRKHEKET